MTTTDKSIQYPKAKDLTPEQRERILGTTALRLWDEFVANYSDGPGLCGDQIAHCRCCAPAQAVADYVMTGRGDGR